jgi:hypothetical protein
VLLLLAFEIESRVCSPRPHKDFVKPHPVLQCEIINVHAGPENTTAIHLHPFRALCQSEFFGFHRFFPVFSGFVRIRALFLRKNPAKRRNVSPKRLIQIPSVAASHRTHGRSSLQNSSSASNAVEKNFVSNANIEELPDRVRLLRASANSVAPRKHEHNTLASEQPAGYLQPEFSNPFGAPGIHTLSPDSDPQG